MFWKRNPIVLALIATVIGLNLVVACSPAASAETVDQGQMPESAETAPVLEQQDPEPDVSWPSPRIHPTMFYDPVAKHIVMFSGMSRMQRKVDLNEVWTYDSARGSWEQIGEMEPKDSLISLGFDEASRQIVTLNNQPRQTWSYDLEKGAWQQRNPSEKPSENPPLGQRFGAGMTYDSESDRLILFGGGAPGKLYADTWAYDYDTDTWEEMHPANQPSPRAMYHLVYDSESDRVILWGGFMEPGVEDVQIWAYDYNSDVWEALENLDGPQQHWERGGAVYIPEMDRILFFTGMREYEDVLVGPETWYYDYNTNSWTLIDTADSPPQLAMYAMVYDPSIRKVVLYGGEGTSKYTGDITSDVWLFDPQEENWSQVAGPARGQE
jgi:N-acetylneuraminic acid mutarotase